MATRSLFTASTPAFEPMTARTRKRLTRVMEGISLWLAFLMLLLVQPVFAQTSEPESEPGAGVLMLSGAGGDSVSATVLKTGYEVTVSGLIARTRLTQSFENTGDDWMEGRYLFPLPENASVYYLKMTTDGGQDIVGRIRPRESARRIYEKARSDGKQAARVEQQRANLFTTHLANIPPGETVQVTLHYQQKVDYRAGEFELRLPTTLTPRYIPGEPPPGKSWRQGWAMPTDQVPDAPAITSASVRPDQLAPDSHRARIRVTLNPGLPLERIESPSHTIRQSPEGPDGAVRVALRQGRAAMDRDFILRWQPRRGQAPSAAVFHEQFNGEDYLMTLLLPGLEEQGDLPRTLVFVMDTSGSMAGNSLDQARRSLLGALDSLKPGDRFNIIRFAGDTSALFSSPVPATRAHLAQARQAVRGYQANGGTEMAPALTESLAQANSAGPEEGADQEAGVRVRQVVFLTDGAVGNEAALFRQIQKQLGQARLFTVAMGTAPNLHFMREAARFGRGRSLAIQGGDQAQSGDRKLTEFLHGIASPVLTDIQSQWPSSTAGQQVWPERPGDLFRREPLMQVARGVSPQSVPSEVVLSGRRPDGSSWQQRLDLQHAASAEGVHREWARQAIDRIEDRRIEAPLSSVDKAEIVRLATEHTLATRLTSFVAVADRPVRDTGDTLRKASVPSLLPAGSATGLLPYPQTATGSQALLLAGIAGFLFALLILALRRRSVQ